MRTGRFTAGHLLLCVLGALEDCSKISRSSDAPIVEEDDPRLFEKHVIVHGYNLDPTRTKFSNNGSDFEFKHGEIAAHSRALLTALECCPGVVAHGRIDLQAATPGAFDRDIRPPKGEFEDTI